MSTITTTPSSKSATALVPDEERGVMRDVSWEFYDRLSDAVGEQSSHPHGLRWEGPGDHDLGPQA